MELQYLLKTGPGGWRGPPSNVVPSDGHKQKHEKKDAGARLALADREGGEAEAA